MAPLKCTIKIESSKEEDYGYIVNPDKHIHKLLTDITLRAIGIMMTNRAKTGLLFLAEKWSTKHQLQFNCKEAVKGFQDILTRASNDLSTWPAVIMDWTMPETIDAWYENVRCEDPEILPDSLPFIVEAEYFSLNGLRVYYLARDMVAKNQEQLVRKLELIWSYCHEIAHFFITYLGLKQKTVQRLHSPAEDEKGEEIMFEAGNIIERRIFGGMYERGRDTSSRDYKFMPGIPLLDIKGVMWGIPLRDVEAIVTKDIASGSYTDKDIAVHRVALPPEDRAHPESQFLSFYKTYRRKFQKAYSPPAQYNDTDVCPAVIRNQMSNSILRNPNGPAKRLNRTAIQWRGKCPHPPKRENRPGPVATTGKQSKLSTRQDESVSGYHSKLLSKQIGSSSDPGGLRHGLQTLSLGGHSSTSGNSREAHGPFKKGGYSAQSGQPSYSSCGSKGTPKSSNPGLK